MSGTASERSHDGACGVGLRTGLCLAGLVAALVDFGLEPAGFLEQLQDPPDAGEVEPVAGQGADLVQPGDVALAVAASSPRACSRAPRGRGARPRAPGCAGCRSVSQQLGSGATSISGRVSFPLAGLAAGRAGGRAPRAGW
jgi:hypothetical protein